MQRVSVLLRLILTSVWIGLIIAISFLEAPLKFTAPGITIPLGLGIGRIMFWALAIAGGAILIINTVLTLFDLTHQKLSGWLLLGGIWLVVLFQSGYLRPAMSGRTDAVIAGTDPGQSWHHYGYIAAEGILFVLLIAYLVHVSKRLTLKTTAGN